METLPSPPPVSLRDWFEAALEIPVAERATWLAQQSIDAGQRARLIAMLAVDTDLSAYPGAPVREWFLAEAEDEVYDPGDVVGKLIGGFRVIRLIGQGGMSCVYEARRESADFDQQVALKVLRRGLHSQLEHRLFRRERQVLAALSHPHIARLIDGGVTDDGLPFLVMEYVDGVAITDYARRGGLSWPARLQLVLAMARAVDAAHQQLIVHRDLKPGNVLVDRQGRVKLLDFGIAKLLDQEATHTRTGVALMTPAYAAPEQIDNQPVTTATDVYALGVVTFELLVGERPGNLSVRASELARQRTDRPGDTAEPLQTRSLAKYLRGDLDNILGKALEREPRLRYRDAGAFADDLERFLDGRAVLAHPPSGWYRARKFIARHRGAVAITALLTLGLFASLGLALWQAREASAQAALARQQAASAAQQAARADAVKGFLLDLFRAAEARVPEGERITTEQLVASAGAALAADQRLHAEARAEVLVALAEVAALIDQDRTALDYLKQAEDLLADGEQLDRQRLRVQAEIASILIRLEQLDAARALLEPMRARADLAEDESAMRVQLSLASLGMAEGRFAKARQAAQRAVALAMKVLPADSSETMEAQTLLASIDNRAGDYEQAEQRLTALYQQWQSAQRGKDLTYARLLASLGSLALNRGQLDQGLARYNEAIELNRQIFPLANRERAEWLKSRAAALEFASRYAEAMRDAEAARAEFSAIYPATHQKVLSAELMIAMITRGIEGPDAAIPLYLKITDACTEHDFNDSVADCGLAFGNLANALSHVGRMPEALLASERSVSNRRALFGDKHPTYAGALAGQAAILYGLDRHDDSLSMLEQAMAISAAGGAGETAAYGRMLRNRADLQLRLGQPEAALASLDRQKPFLERFSAGNARHQFEWLAFRAFALFMLNQTDAAREHAQRALAIEVDTRALDPVRWQKLRALAGR